MEKPIAAWIAVILAAFMVVALAGTAHAADLSVEETFERAAYAYRLDPDLLISIATLESGYGSSQVAQNRNNWFGWTRYDGSFMTFDSPQAGIWHVARAISRRPHDTIEELAAWYNAPYREVWAERVKEIYEKK